MSKTSDYVATLGMPGGFDPMFCQQIEDERDALQSIIDPMRQSMIATNAECGKLLAERDALQAILDEQQTPSLPDARPRSDRFRCGGRESNFLAACRT
jgi:cobyrinic acid a,c-diamide synthase